MTYKSFKAVLFSFFKFLVRPRKFQLWIFKEEISEFWLVENRIIKEFLIDILNDGLDFVFSLELVTLHESVVQEIPDVLVEEGRLVVKRDFFVAFDHHFFVVNKILLQKEFFFDVERKSYLFNDFLTNHLFDLEESFVTKFLFKLVTQKFKVTLEDKLENLLIPLTLTVFWYHFEAFPCLQGHIKLFLEKY